MSHNPAQCEQHIWSAWSTELRSLAEGAEPVYVFSRSCFVCDAIEDSSSACLP